MGEMADADKCRAWVAYEGILVASLILTVDIIRIARGS